MPTLTAVSRQAAYAGRPPFYLGEGIYTTAREPARWNQFWINQGLARAEIGYMKVLGDGDPGEVDILAGEPRLRVLGLVINKVDKIMHGMQLGTAGMHNQVRQWAEEGYLSGLLELLWARGFDVYLTSDHGNIEAGGCGVTGEGVTAELRGERARVYPSEILRKQVHAQFPGSIAWPPLGLPEDYLPLLAPPRKAFVRQDERIVAHGGISIEEVIVPFIHLERRQV
ncbi:BREX-3 system phosphatase PglZ [Moorella naiadis]|uniref:BREX-3 system phosphatase PglZ n=1 Tax=Moorella naiadis (nom. illeg.) TaxID=3093670 RepID=UPI003D9C9B46